MHLYIGMSCNWQRELSFCNTAMLAHTSCSCAKQFHRQPQVSSLSFYSLERSPPTARPYLSNNLLQSTNPTAKANRKQPSLTHFLIGEICGSVHISESSQWSGEWVIAGTDNSAVNISWHKINQTPTPASSSLLGLGCTGIWLPGNPKKSTTVLSFKQTRYWPWLLRFKK